MPFSRKKLIEELLDVQRKDPERFDNFYKSVTNLIASIPEGGRITIEEVCDPKSRDLFFKISILFIFELQSYQKDPASDYFDILDDENTIIHQPRLSNLSNKRRNKN